MRRLGSVSAVVGVGLGLGGCGWMDLEKFRKVSFDLPEISASVDPGDGKWKAPPVAALPAVPCTDGNAASCCQLPAPAPAFDCATYPLSCQQGTCGYDVVYESSQTLDLKKMAPALANVEEDALTAVLLKELDYRLKNGLNVPVPAIDVFVAPASATSASNPAAKRLVTLPGAAAGAEIMQKIPLSGEAQQAFSTFARSFRTPFNLISVARVRLTSGSPTPTGRADATVSGKGEAQF